MKTDIKKPLFAALLTVSILAVAGCEPCPHYNRLQTVSYYGVQSKKPRGTIIPFQTAADVKRPYAEIGFMSCEGSAGEEGAILKAMLYRAADMGADAIILNPGKVSEENTSGQNISVRVGWMALIGNSNTFAFRALAIRFTDTNSPPATLPPTK